MLHGHAPWSDMKAERAEHGAAEVVRTLSDIADRLDALPPVRAVEALVLFTPELEAVKRQTEIALRPQAGPDPN